MSALDSFFDSSAPLDSKSQFAELVAISTQQPGSFFERGTEDAVRLLRKVVTFLNDPDASFKTKLIALLVLANVAKLQRRRKVVARAIKLLDLNLEKELNANLAGRKKFGTTLGRHHELLLVLFSRVSGYRLDAESVLELVDGDTALALELVCAALKVKEYEDGVVLSLCSSLEGLVEPIAFVQDAGAGGVAAFTARSNQVLAQTMAPKVQVFDSLTAAFSHRCFDGGRSSCPLSPTLQSGIIAALSFIHNLYLHSTEGTTELRQHLLVSTELSEKLIVPFVVSSVEHSPALLGLLGREGNGDASSFTQDPLLLRGLSLALKALVLLNFRAKRHRSRSRRANSFTPQLLQARAFLQAHPAILALLLLHNVNIDAFCEEESGPTSDPLPSECGPESILQQLESTLMQVGSEAAASVQGMILYPRHAWLPISRDLPSWEVLLTLLDRVQQNGQLEGDEVKLAEGEDDSVCGAEADFATALSFESKGAEPEMEGKQNAEPKPSQFPPVEPHRPKNSTTIAFGRSTAKKEEEGPPTAALTIPKKRSSSKKRRARKSKRPDGGSSSGRLYGSTGATVGGSSTSISATEMDETPSEFKCAINGHASAYALMLRSSAPAPRSSQSSPIAAVLAQVMKEPMRSPHGHHFERVTIETWLRKLGSVCPITGEPLTKADLNLDSDLQTKICSWHMSRSLELQSAAAEATLHAVVACTDEDAGLYDF